MELEKTYEPQRFEPHWAAMVGRVRHLPRRRQSARTAIFTRRPAAQRHRLAAHRPHARHTAHRHRHTLASHARRQHACSCPGIDHAGIATQMLVERSLAAEGLTRQQLGREEFVRRVWEWKEKYGSRITAQMKRIGDSCDWSRERFTLSPELLACGAGSFRAPLRARPHLSRHLHGELVPALPHRAVRSRSEARGHAGQPVAHPLSGEGRLARIWWSPPRARKRCWATLRWL